MSWKTPIACLLPDEIPVFALDDDTDQFKTVGELKAYMAEQDKRISSIHEQQGHTTATEDTPDETKWINVEDKMPFFYKDNILSDHVWAKGRDGVVIKNAGLFSRGGLVSCAGSKIEQTHNDIIQWQPLNKRHKNGN